MLRVGFLSKIVPRSDYRNCKSCGRSSAEVGPLSHSRLCGDCGVARLNTNNLEIHAKTGASWHRWRRQMAACVGGVLVDDLREGT